MFEKKARAIVLCDRVIRYSLYALIFLTPLFFLPLTQNFLETNKQLLLIGLVFLAMFAWLAKALISAKLTLSLNKVTLALGILLLASFVSTMLSLTRNDSFWGTASNPQQSFVSLLCVVLIYFLISSHFSKKEVIISLVLLEISSTLACLYGVLQLAGLYSLPLVFAQNVGFNTVGSPGSLGILAASLLPLSLVFFMIDQKWHRILFFFNAVLTLMILVALNSTFLWWVALLGSALIVFFWIIQKDVFDARFLALPIFFVMVALFFIVVNPGISLFHQKPIEVNLPQKDTVDIDALMLKENPIFGFGPGNFIYGFLKYKSKNFNQREFWNINFTFGASGFLTDVVSSGTLAVLAFLTAMMLLFIASMKKLLAGGWQKIKSKSDELGQYQSWVMPLSIGLTASFSAQIVSYFLYNFNVTIAVVLFFSMGALVSLVFDSRKTFVILPHSLVSLLVTSVLTALFIFGAGFLVLAGQRYVADVYYYKASQAFALNEKDRAIDYVKKAINQNSRADRYFNQLALFSLAKLQQEVLMPDAAKNPEIKKSVQALARDSVIAINTALAINPINVENWSAKGYICRNLAGLIADASECASQSYDKAIALSPANPYLFLQQGSLHVASQDFVSAKNSFMNAIGVKADYAPAYFQLALLARLTGDFEAEALAFDKVKKYAPGDSALYFQIGLVYYQDKYWQKAQDNFQTALLISPNYAEALYYSGITYDWLGQKNKTLEVFLKLLEANPNNKNIQKIVDNLRAGKAALTSILADDPVTKKTP